MKFLKAVCGRLDTLPIGVKLNTSFLVLLALTGMLGLTSIMMLSEVNQVSGDLAARWLPAVGHTGSVRIAMLETRDLEQKHARAGDTSYMAEYEEKLAASRKLVEQHLGDLRALATADDGPKLLEAVGKAWGSYLTVNERVVKLSRAGKQEDARDIGDGAAKMALDESLDALDRLTAYSFSHGQQAAERSVAVYGRSRMTTGALVAVALVIGLLLAWAIRCSLFSQLGGEPSQAAAVARAVASGDLTARVPLRDGDSRSIMAALTDMQDSLSRMVASVRTGAERLAAASAEISHGNNDLAARTEEQARALEQTSSAMLQLGEAVTSNADNASHADRMAGGASEVATRGGQAVHNVVDTMKGINDSSGKIAEITGVIDSIAFQTNILALNAAVEAARAGEQGRGFAVVAGEVRTLAQRSADAARQIKGLIADSVARVGQGSQQVDLAGKTMSEIVDAIGRVTALMGEIRTASAEQSQGVAQVRGALERMDSATQQNAALVEQSAAASERLKVESASLVEAVAVFKLRG